MITSLLLAAAMSAAPVRAQVQAPRTAALKAEALKRFDQQYAYATGGRADLLQLRSDMLSLEAEENAFHQKAAARIRAEAVANSLSADERDRRLAALSRLRDLRVAYLYGNMFPRHALEIGPRDASRPAWPIAIPFEAVNGPIQAAAAETGLPHDYIFND